MNKDISKKKPNLIYVFADQLGIGHVGYSGNKKALTPNIDRIKKECLDFNNAVSGHPVCAPYRASLFTGKYTTSTGMVINEIRLNPNHRSMANVLNDGGYTTAYIGKWHMYANEWGNHYDVKNSFIPKGEHRLGFDEYFAAYNFHHEYYGECAYYHLDTDEKLYCDGYEPDVQTDMAMNKIKELAVKDKPFALFLSLGTPHDPWIPENVPKEYLDKFKDVSFELPPNYLPENDKYADDWAKLSPKERNELTQWMRVYYAMTANLDDNIGRLYEMLEETGILDNSIFIFTADHGELFGAHGRRAKNIFYEEAVRIPFLMKWGDRLSRKRCDVCLNTVDLMPTLLTMLELPVPDEVEGVDLSGYIMGNTGAKEPEGSLMMGTGATAKWEDGHEWRAFRTKQYTYAKYLSDGKELLFDNINDPYQMKDLSQEEEYKEILLLLKNSMSKEMARVGDEFQPSSYYEENWVTKDRLITKTKSGT